MEQPKPLRQQTYKVITQEITQNFFNIGKESNLRNESNCDWINVTPSRHDHIRNSFITLSLRKNLSISAKTVSKGGKPLVYHNHGKTITAKKVQYDDFSQLFWPNGLISNYKRISKKSKPLPNLVITSNK
jgi:hypothetical protein